MGHSVLHIGRRAAEVQASWAARNLHPPAVRAGGVRGTGYGVCKRGGVPNGLPIGHRPRALNHLGFTPCQPRTDQPGHAQAGTRASKEIQNIDVADCSPLISLLKVTANEDRRDEARYHLIDRVVYGSFLPVFHFISACSLMLSSSLGCDLLSLQGK